MIKQISKMECKIGERVFQLYCESDSPLADVKESMFQFLKYIGHIEDAAKQKASQEEPEKAPEEPIG